MADLVHMELTKPIKLSQPNSGWFSPLVFSTWTVMDIFKIACIVTWNKSSLDPNCQVPSVGFDIMAND